MHYYIHDIDALKSGRDEPAAKFTIDQQEMGMDKAVRGVIVEHTERGIKWFYANEPVYVTEKGEVLPKKQADAGIRSKKWIPGTSPLSDTIRLVNRHP